MWLADQWKDFAVLDSSDGMKLERWGDVILQRPDPQVIWKQPQLSKTEWERAAAVYHRSNKGGGKWEQREAVPERWTVSYRDLTFHIKMMGFKHTGLFPEQAVNWDFVTEQMKQSGRRDLKILNLFAYTGGATVAAAAAGAEEVVHVDSSKGMVAWAKENIAASGLQDRKVRFIVDDVLKFVAREIRRGRKYDGIIMDPPSYGRGPGGEVWKLEDEIYGLLSQCMQILSDHPLFFLVNSYTTGFSPSVVSNMMALTISEKFGGTTVAQEIGLPIGKSGLVLPCGATARWVGDNR